MAVSKALRASIFARNRLICRYCGRGCVVISTPASQPPETATVDHIAPGGGDDPANLVTACKGCNSAKRNKTAEQYRDWLVARFDSEETRL